MSSDSVPRSGQPAQEHIQQILAARARFDALKSESGILFADLVGSTEYKHHHSEIEGLQKTALHNAVVSDCVKRFDGHVAKYLGDGVLAVFDKSRALPALQCALATLTAIETANSSQGWHKFPHAMSTKIGIDFGPVWNFDYPPVHAADPQGLVVDIASRLSGLAQAQQIVITERAFQAARAGAEATGGQLALSSGQPTPRLVRGLLHPINLVSIARDGEQPGDIAIVGYKRKVTEQSAAKLKEGLSALRKDKNRFAALRAFDAAVLEDPGNFEACYRAADLLLTGKPESCAREREILEQVIGYLDLAVQIRPESPRAWYLASWTRFRRFELLRNENDLHLAVRFAGLALEKAEDLMDVDGALIAKTCLARKLLERSEWFDPESRKRDLSEAARLCEEVASVVGELHSSVRAEFLVTHALVRLAQGDQDFDNIEKMILDADSLDTRNVKILAAQTRLKVARTSAMVSGDARLPHRP